MQFPHARWRKPSLGWVLPAALVVLAGAFVGTEGRAYEGWHDSVDYTRLRNALGSQTPTGAGVPLSQVEAMVSGAYYVFPDHVEFDPVNDPTLPMGVAVSFTDGTGQAGSNISTHANNVGSRFYGNTSSVAPGANSVTVYEANSWLQDVLRTDQSPGDGTHPAEPIASTFRVQNHSWVGSYGSTTQLWIEDARNVDALRRFDYMIDTAFGGQGMLAAVGLNNSQNPLPYLLSHSYNAITVGRSDGFHSSGFTLAYDGSGANDSYGPGRSKPDIVGPSPAVGGANTASTATAMVSSTAALLYSSATGTDAMNGEVVKAMLMAGATKSEFPGWNRTTTRPLDDTYGAGELNVYNSYLTQLGGRGAGSLTQPSTAVGSYGWDYKDLKSQPGAGDVFYNLVIPEGSHALELSVVLTWNVKVTDAPGGTGFNPTQALQNLDLRLQDSSSTFLGAIVDQSLSTVDNVEHLYLTNLDPGTYTLRVSGAAGWDYGIAWRMTTRFDQVNADFDGNGMVDGFDFLAWQRGAGTLVGAAHGDGDADGDGDVDDLDYAAYQAGVMPPVARALRVAAVVAEPSSAALAGLLLAASSVFRRRRGR